MASRGAFLLECAPDIEVRGDHFFIDYDVEGVPTIALTPHALLAKIEALRRAYARWAETRSEVLEYGGHHAASEEGLYGST
jgi:hypothetical protein